MEPVAPLDATQERAAESAARRVAHVAFGCGLAVALLVIGALLVYLLWAG